MKRSEKALNWLRFGEGDGTEFAPDIIKTQQQPPSPLPRAVLYADRGDTNRAVEQYRISLEHHPADARALSGLGSAATIFVDPTVAGLLKDVNGFATKRDLSKWLSENVEKTVASYWGNGVITTSNMALAFQGLEPYATWSKLPRDSLIKPFNNPRAINIVVVGGAIQTVWFGTDFRLGRGVKVDDWR